MQEINLNDTKINALFCPHKRYNIKYRPHRIFQNWSQRYMVPWVCFLEILIMALYFLFGFFHQKTAIVFTLDFSKAVDDYFLSGFDFPTDDNGNIEDQVNIYFKSKFLDVANETGVRFLRFQEDFPCTNSLTFDGFLKVYITFKGTTTIYQFNKLNVSNLYQTIECVIDQFDQIAFYSSYSLETDTNDVIDLTIVSSFTFDRDTKIVVLDMHHTRIPHTDIYKWQTVMQNPLITFPSAIAIFALISIVVQINYTRSIYVYSNEKARVNFLKTSHIFWEKYDKWTIFSFICHIISIIACVLYAANHSDYKESVPATLILMGIASFLHCVLLCRYLRLIGATNLILTVTAKAAIKIGSFLVGCILIFIAYLLFGCSFFGIYDDTFRTFIDGAECLLAVVHGDSIYSMFESAATRPNLNEWVGIIYWAIWIFFSLTIMFNISISIFEDVLTDEINGREKDKLKKKLDEDLPNDQFTFALPICYKRFY